MKKYTKSSVQKFLSELSSRTPVPGGGSAAALTAATGAALISMVVHYSIGKSQSKIKEQKFKTILKKSEHLRKRLTELIDEDAKAYLDVVHSRKGSDLKRRKTLNRAAQVPLEVSRLCYQAIQMTPFLVKNGNKNLMSDVEVAIELFFSAFKSAMINVSINQ